jgi:hypothetical protein
MMGFPAALIGILPGWEKMPMSGKFTLLLKKRQAETYRSHGLHKEALAIYNNLLTTTPNIDPDLKTTIQTKMRDIEADMADFSSRREGAFTAQDINRIMQEWGESAGETDRLVCVHALCSVRSYGDASEELKKLLHQGGVKAIYVDLAIDCLTNLHPPDGLPAAVDEFVSACPLQPEAAISFQLSMAEHLARRSEAQRATVLYRHLLRKDDLAEETAAHITAALEKLATAPAAVPLPPPAPAGTAAENASTDDSPIVRFGLSGIRTFLKIFNKRCRSLLASIR